MPRSGTNYLENQLILHSQCFAPGPIWEDFLVSSTPLLESLRNKLKLHWDSYWFRNTNIDFSHKLGLDIGNGLKNFLLSQINIPDAKYLVTKTPTIRGLEYYLSYFSGSKLIIIIRDGRDVAESGMNSFGWDFVKAIYDWKINSRKIVDFLNKNPNSAFLVRFEDLFTTPEETMSEAIEYLELDITNYPFDKLKDMPVSGSSMLKSEKGELNWKPIEKEQNFRPVSRYKSWSAWKKFLFIVIAGGELQAFGYDIREEVSLLQKFQAYLYLAFWPVLMIPRTLYYLLKEKTFVLKTH